jgi:hypothetical protein
MPWEEAKDEEPIVSVFDESEAFDKILKRIELSRQLLLKLKALTPTPPYAESVLESALHNKTRVLEAHLSTVTSDEAQRKRMIRELDEHSRNAYMYAAAYGNLEALELLAAADIDVHVTDKYHRSAMHYAAMNDSSKVVEAVFLAHKASGKKIWLYGQQEEDGNSPMRHPPIPTFTPYKGLFDHMPPLKKSTAKKEEVKMQLFKQETPKDDEDDAGF